MQYYDLYHQNAKQYSTDLEAVKPGPYSSWPEDWKTVHIKKYMRFPIVSLPEVRAISVTLADSLLQRKSRREFSNVLHLSDISDLLYYSLGEIKEETDNGGRRMYASGGALYPLEAYVLFFKEVDGVTPGVYHYNVDTHDMSYIYKKTFDKAFFEKMVVYNFLHNATCAILLTAVMGRVYPKYKEHAYRFALLEAGEVSQNLALLSTALHIDSVSTGILSADIVEDLLDIDGTDELFIHSLFFG